MRKQLESMKLLIGIAALAAATALPSCNSEDVQNPSGAAGTSDGTTDQGEEGGQDVAQDQGAGAAGVRSGSWTGVLEPLNDNENVEGNFSVTAQNNQLTIIGTIQGLTGSQHLIRIHSEANCPTADDDLNNDGTLSEAEVRSVAGDPLIDITESGLVIADRSPVPDSTPSASPTVSASPSVGASPDAEPSPSVSASPSVVASPSVEASPSASASPGVNGATADVNGTISINASDDGLALQDEVSSLDSRRRRGFNFGERVIVVYSQDQGVNTPVACAELDPEGASPSPSPSATASPSPTATASPSPTATASPSPSPTATASPSPSPTAIPTDQITIAIPAGATSLGNNAFGVNPRVVPPGTTVTWVNNDTVPHTVTSTQGRFDSETLETGERFSFTSETAGDYPYFCEIHPSMRGTIRVSGSAP